ncbi:hypothetical protein TBLA_0B00940 [Henningerozyma blattae CBS 6284]|uniref:Uncharacterized protein n=1 Tax=Henningerozyma blattae (strain ATCC 34711 / CBS 6284 / DSM 70876 / NBRC 10599 / NRRL Y-10934 / UCD 77-7) TaxID=1071380 RepID=I2GXT5_HENB6|nr:hypothetical protein TBLA_0B00940 [Tetrapisispora blattae CBS 6284]CCH58937.1 hypothetical protein TBLA_0B00940 [Tetrapisispora blattae CBS 6284]
MKLTADDASTLVLPQTTTSLIINVISLISASYGLNRASALPLPPTLAKAGDKQFLTNISVIATILSNIAGICNYFIQRRQHKDYKIGYPCDGKKRANFVSRHLLLPLALVLETIVPLVYWPLRLFFINLIMQGADEVDHYPIPVLVDVAIHLFPFIALFADHYLSGSDNKFILSNSVALVVVTTLGIAYNRWLAFIIDFEAGQKNPYPFLDVREPFRSVIFACVTTVAWGCYALYQKYPPRRELPINLGEKKLL